MFFVLFKLYEILNGIAIKVIDKALQHIFPSKSHNGGSFFAIQMYVFVLSKYVSALFELKMRNKEK